MIFVTVGTHEQPFDRLLACMDRLKADGTISEEVVIQTGFSTYQPKSCTWQKLFPFSKMNELVQEARIVITHGGPSSFIMPLQIGKIPVVVPRQKQYDEHVNDHQVDFCREVARRQGNIIEVEDVEKLGEVLTNYDHIVTNMKHGQGTNNNKFCRDFSDLVDDMFRR